MEFSIRKAVINEAHDFALCKIRAWQSAYRGIIPDEYLNNMSVEKYAELYKKWMENPNAEYYFAMCNDEIAGILVLSKCDNDDKQNAGDITAIYLLEPYWNKGYGRIMMNYAINRLKSLLYEEITIWSLEKNARAHEFFEKFGFALDGKKMEMNWGEPSTIIRHVINLS